MEYELLNSMLTVSVSNLFINNRLKHMRYFMSEEAGEKIDIPKSSTRRREEDLGISLNNNKTQNAAASIEQWRTKDSKKKLADTMAKLGINEAKINDIDLSNFSLEYLEEEKSKIKKELQELDKDFLRQFNRMPEKNEKEIYRPLYIYYRELKFAIEAKKSGKPLKQKNKEVSSKEKEKKSEVNKESINKIESSQKETSKRSQSTGNTITSESKKDEQLTKIHKEDQGGMLLSQDESQYKGRSASAKNKRYTNTEIEEFKKELETLKMVQLEYKEKLHDYQMDFLKKNNRKVKFYKDIIEVEFEYNAYKENRVKIRDIEEILSNHSAKN